MVYNDIATLTLLFATLVISIVALGSPAWIKATSPSRATYGLFEICISGKCAKLPSDVSEPYINATAAVFITGVIAQAAGICCISIGLVWSNRKLAKVALVFPWIAASFLIASCIVFTVTFFTQPRNHQSIGFSFYWAWSSAALSLFSAICVLLNSRVRSREHKQRRKSSNSRRVDLNGRF